MAFRAAPTVAPCHRKKGMIGPLAPPVPHMESGAHLGVRCNHSFSHGEVTEGITVEGEESVDTKKYAVDGIPREYKRSMVSGANFSLAHPPTLKFLPPNTRHPVWRILVNFTSPNSEKW